MSTRNVTAPASIRILAANFKPYRKNTLLGFVDLRLPDVGLTLMGATLHEKDGSRWVGLPAKPYTNEQGQTSWAQIVDFDSKDARQTFQSAALRAIEALEPTSTHQGAGDEP